MDITEDQTSSQQLRESFRGIAADRVSLLRITYSSKRPHLVLQPYVTELDLRLAHLSQSAIDYLRQAMPSKENGAGESEYDYEAWLDDVFA